MNKTATAVKEMGRSLSSDKKTRRRSGTPSKSKSSSKSFSKSQSKSPSKSQSSSSATGLNVSSANVSPTTKKPGNSEDENGLMRFLGRIFWRKIITEDELVAITKHKFVSGDPTPLDYYVIFPFWRKLVDYVPTWIHPNLITLVGTIPLLALYGLLCMKNQDFLSSDVWCPDAILLTAIAFEFFYQTMDGIDGIQARRIGVASVLGCLFDHGCDCLANIAHVEIVLTLLAPVSWNQAFLGSMCLMTTFFTAQWKHALSGIHCINVGPIGVTETQYSVMGLILCRYLVGPEKWAEGLHAPSIFENWSRKDAGLVGWCVFCGCICFLEVPTVMYKHARTWGKFQSGCMQLLPLVILNLVMFTFPVSLWKTAPNTRLLMFLYVLNAVYLTIQEIVYTAANSCMRLHQQVCLFIVIGTTLLCNYFIFSDEASENLDLENQEKVLKYSCILTSLLLMSWITSATSQLKNKLNIRVFHTKMKSA